MPILDLNTLFGFWPRAAVDLSVDVLVETIRARQAGARGVTFSAKALFYDAGEGNEDTAAVCAGRPELIPAAVIDPRAYPRCLEEVRKRREQGFPVFRLSPDVHGYPIDFAPLEALLPEMTDSLVLISTRQPGAATALARRVAAMDLSVALDPGGTDTLGEVLAAMQTAPKLFLETTSLLAAGAIEAAVRTCGASRLLFGSGSPLRAFSSALMSVQFAELSDPDRSAILGENLARLLENTASGSSSQTS
jgi:predicted TIM-barrel fold metal-dependent hydrolase